MDDLEGRIALVTGGAKGIGRGVVECLSEAGATVLVADVDVVAADELAAEVSGTAVVVAHDVSRASDALVLEERIRTEFGGLDILVNNAGVGPQPMGIQDMPEEEWDRVMDVNARGVFLTSRALVPLLMESNHGRMVNISSILGQTGAAFVVHYVASKFAVTGMSQALAKELAPYDVTVNCIHPGVLETELHASVVRAFSAMERRPEQELWDWFQDLIPLRRFQTPRDVGEMAAFLASDRARNVTGASFNVDGGWGMH